jgi:hypothetical protein
VHSLLGLQGVRYVWGSPVLGAMLSHLRAASPGWVSPRHRAGGLLTLDDDIRRDAEEILRARYRRVTGDELDLTRAERFIDKLYARMLSQHQDPDPRLTELTDKFRARAYARRCIGRRHLVRLHWHGADPAKIPFDSLPDRFVVKSNHACGHVIRVHHDVDRADVVARAESWVEENYYWRAREAQYLGIQPRILVEEYLDDGFPDGPLDYRYYCFAGRPSMIQVSDHSHAVHLFFDTRWRPLPVRFRPDRAVYDVPRPAALAEMTRLASTLAQPFDFVRVDLYNIHGDVRFGEMTFTPQAGYRLFQPDSVERELGRLWGTAAERPGRLRTFQRRAGRA